jgi:phosphatidylserine/phosphatidylglycerophosphate/cardiolipin synthase-like enzyme
MFRRRISCATLLSSDLYNQDTFYTTFARDLSLARDQVIIESPFITSKRVAKLVPAIRRLTGRGVQVVINTKPIDEHNEELADQASFALCELQELGVLVLFTVGHHRKLAIIDESIVWEGSLNILSQNDSCEIMRRIDSPDSAKHLLAFINLKRFL